MNKLVSERLDRKVFVDRLQALMKLRKTNALAVSREAGLGNTAVSDIINEKNKNPSIPVARAIARVLKCNLAYLVGEQEVPLSGGQERTLSPVPIVGVAETGAFRAMPQFDQEHDEDLPQVQAPRSKLFPRARHFALEIRGDSMNAAKPAPFVQGMFALCVDLVDAELEIESGRIYAVRRTLDGGSTFELTIKRARVFRDRVELHPESTNPKHKPITIKRVRDTDMTNEVKAIGLVYGVFNSFED